MARQAASLADSLIGHLGNLEKTRAKMQRLLNQGTIVRRDIEQVYEGLYLDVITSFEQFIENLFIGLLVGRVSVSSPSVVPRVSFKSDRVARDVVFAGRKYVDWLPYDNTENRPTIFFRKGLPFTSLEPQEKQLLQQFCYLRNAIAHESAHSRRMFEEHVVGSLTLSPRERTPSGYLQEVFRITPHQTRYEHAVIEIAAIAKKICT